MTYDLFIGDRTFSSWSLRGWLMLEKFGLAHRTHMVGLYAGTMAQDIAQLAPARLVPVLRTPEGNVVGESLAMAETLAERHPDAGLWPREPSARMRARWLCAEMASGFSALRSQCPMQLQHVNTGFVAKDAVLSDLERLQELWQGAFKMTGHADGWLFDTYSLADVFFAPVAARIIGYDLPVSQQALDYCMRTLRDPAFRAWRSDGLKITYDPFPYPAGTGTKPWPVS
ncbi:glutathione S-transferase [Roseobacter denitrificans]|uniref:Conserved domain protein n=1 Tax=Roseobacter denitrificans (strain ATCC 33942 / OCh 114) TaxID=375451 RepID=Q16AZ9_ROSDO|nr:glutathione S-transferase [Roseobacter denitrificans]ABG30844.1 conserved domain protein [Roseobacter denitrificans OCh 114]AVL53948.1 glutathione S-transferase [Roseobacter denitrificans]SFG15377.1 glutathione S-transferase [Roseobacter denitrificans OCh 114]